MFNPIAKLKDVRILYETPPTGDCGRCLGLMQPRLEGSKVKVNIYVSPELDEINRFAITIHEAMHLMYQDMSEDDVDKSANMLAEILWIEGYKLRE